MPSQQTEPPPLPIGVKSFTHRSVSTAIRKITEEIQAQTARFEAHGDEKAEGLHDELTRISSQVYLLSKYVAKLRKEAKPAPDAEAIEQIVATEALDLHRRFDALVGMVKHLETRFDTVDREIKLTANDVSVSRALSEETVRYAQKIPKVLKTSQATLILADRAAKAGAKQSRLTETTLSMLADMRAKEKPATPAIVEHDVGQTDIISNEPRRRDNVYPIRPVRRSAIGMVAALALTFTTAAFSMSGAPYMDDVEPKRACTRDLNQKDVYDCGTGHLWIATKQTPNPDGGVDLDLKPYTP